MSGGPLQRECYPTLVIIDKSGVACLIHPGMVTSASEMANAIQIFIAYDYDKPILLTEMPRLPVTQTAESEKLSAALNAEGGNLQFTSLEIDDTLWPFLPAEDGKSAMASNSDIENSTANVIAILNGQPLKSSFESLWLFGVVQGVADARQAS